MYFLKSLLHHYSDWVSEATAQLNNFRSAILVGLCVSVVVYFVSEEIRRLRSNCLPGPRGFPIVGYLPFLTPDMHLDMMEMAKKYGDVFSLRVGMMNVVVVNGGDAIKEAFAKSEFLGRPPEGSLKVLNAESAFNANTVQLWREQRRFVVQSLKELGLGKTKIEGETMEEINLLMNFLRNQNSDPINLEVPLSPSMSNNICALIFGKRLDYSNPERKMLDSMLSKGLESVSQTALMTFLPWIRHIPFQAKFMKLGKSIDAFQAIGQVFRKEIKKHRDTFDPRNVRDFIDSYFIEMERQKKDSPFTSLPS